MPKRLLDLIQTIWPFLASVFIGSLVFIAALFRWRDVNDPRPVAAGAFLFFVSLVITEHVKTTGLVRTYGDNTNKAILALKEFEFLGRVSENFGAMLSACADGDEINNTLILFDVADEGYLASHVEQIQKQIENMLRSGKRWIDIVSPETLVSERLDWLNFAMRMKANASYHYTLRCLKESYPMVNFTLSRRNNVSQRVAVGGGHHRYESDGNVFLSTKDEIVSSFEALWGTLHHDSEEIDLKQVAQSVLVTPSSISGDWLTLSYNESQTFKDVGYVQIFSEGRKIQAKGELFDAAGERVRGGHKFGFTFAHIEDIKLWFVSDYNGKESLGWYKFRGALGKAGSFSGHLNPEQQGEEFWVFGVRLIDSDASTMTYGGPEDRREVIERRKSDIEAIKRSWPARS